MLSRTQINKELPVLFVLSKLAWKSPPILVSEMRSRDVVNISSHIVLKHINLKYVLDSMWYSSLILVGGCSKFCFYLRLVFE